MVLNFREKAEKRASDLWEYYNANGSLSLSDFKRITGGQYESVKRTFETYGIEVPIIYDCKKEKTRQKAIVLTNEAKKLKQDYLTISQAAKVLNEKANRVIGIEGRILRCGFSVPEIVTEKGVSVMSGNNNNNDSIKIHGTINPLYYPAGLQVMSWRLNELNETIHYLIR